MTGVGHGRTDTQPADPHEERHRLHGDQLYSYVTLIVTGIAQAFEHLPFESDLLNAVFFVQAPALIGWALIEFRGVPRWRKRFAPLSANKVAETTTLVNVALSAMGGPQRIGGHQE